MVLLFPITCTSEFSAKGRSLWTWHHSCACFPTTWCHRCYSVPISALFLMSYLTQREVLSPQSAACLNMNVRTLCGQEQTYRETMKAKTSAKNTFLLAVYLGILLLLNKTGRIVSVIISIISTWENSYLSKCLHNHSLNFSRTQLMMFSGKLT